jgi:integrase
MTYYLDTEINNICMGEQNVNAGEVLQQYKQYLTAQYTKPKTRYQYYRIAKDFLYSCNQVNKDTIEQYIGNLNHKGLKHNTIASHTNCLNLFLKWYNHPELCLDYKEYKEINRDVLNTEEIINVINECKSFEELLICYFIVDLDARTSEICEARWSRVGREKYYFSESKTGNNYGFMTERFKKALYQYKEKERPRPVKGYEDYVFIHQYGRYQGYPFKSHGAKIRSIMDGLGKRIGVLHLLPYDLRSSVITEEFNNHLNPKLVQVKARHKQFTTTNRYNKAGEKELREYAQKGTVFDEAEISKDSKGLFKRKSGNKHSLLKRFDTCFSTEIKVGVNNSEVDGEFHWSTIVVDDEDEEDFFRVLDTNNVYNRIKPFCIVNGGDLL